MRYVMQLVSCVMHVGLTVRQLQIRCLPNEVRDTIAEYYILNTSEGLA